jgi:hypothetical protein
VAYERVKPTYSVKTRFLLKMFEAGTENVFASARRHGSRATNTYIARRIFVARKKTVRSDKCHHLIACLLTPRSRVLPEKLTGLQLVKKISAFYGT